MLPNDNGKPVLSQDDLTREQFKLSMLDAGKFHAVPLVLAASIWFIPKLVIVWILFLFIWFSVEAIGKSLPRNFRCRVAAMIPPAVANSKTVHELHDGITQVRPFIVGALYMGCAPVAIVWMLWRWCWRMSGFGKTKQKAVTQTPDSIIIAQNMKETEEEEESNFFHSPAFGITCLLLFACGLPAAATVLVFHLANIGAVYHLAAGSLTAALVQHYFLKLYILSVACCASTLFIRTWFTFPLNFFGDQARIELNARGLTRHRDSWCTQVLTMNSPGGGADRLSWDEVRALGVERRFCFYPLPKENCPPILYSFMNALAMLFDSITARGNRGEFIYFTTNAEELKSQGVWHQMQRSLQLNISEMDGNERARLFYAVRQWAPQVEIDPQAQERLLGSKVLQPARYTQIWFDLLTQDMPRRYQRVLPEGTGLKHGALRIEQRIATGGQANVYSAVDADGRQLILKEFVLSSSDAVGALVESAADFETESSLLSMLSHPRIVGMLDFFAEDKRLYIAMEKVEGQSLRRRVKDNGVLSEKETIEIGLQLCEVLSYLHGLTPPVVHRDLAPDNLIWSAPEGIKVIDFCLAASGKSRRTTSTMGKHCYAPPEQLQEQPCPQSDIYALGATMYFLLTGEDPKPITCADVRAKRPAVSERLQALVAHATAYELEDRVPDADWLAVELQSLLAESGEAEPRTICSATG